ncbi:hypothetical protein [Nitrospirillum amazonense]|uniref:hypothetical protein n=1 Tax=Nitrospirillum amazonense TaxID=28077 RepID=UPI0024126F32|nr:hypothetical protein [Nitrospirillum amazonense]MDG3444671.1 hypothetical protein [Nitrospirillum amazonense]
MAQVDPKELHSLAQAFPCGLMPTQTLEAAARLGLAIPRLAPAGLSGKPDLMLLDHYVAAPILMDAYNAVRT